MLIGVILPDGHPWRSQADSHGVITFDGQVSELVTASRTPLDLLLMDLELLSPDCLPDLRRYRVARPGTRIVVSIPHDTRPGNKILVSCVGLGVYDILSRDTLLSEALAVVRSYADVAQWHSSSEETTAAARKWLLWRNRGSGTEKKTRNKKDATSPQVQEGMNVATYKGDQEVKTNQCKRKITFQKVITEGFVYYDDGPMADGTAYHKRVKELCESNPVAVLLSAGRKDLIENIKTLRRESALAAIPLVVVGDCDAAACFAAGANECVEDLSEKAITRIRAKARQMKELWSRAVRDDLTGLYNRGFLDAYLKEQELRFQESGTKFSLLLADLDYFKNVNDKHGHQAGDMVLKEFASFLRNHIRQTDVAARYGGEEFLIVFPGTGIKEAGAIAEKLRRTWEVHVTKLSSGQKIRCTFSAGLAVMGKDAGDAEGLLGAADRALYRAKEAGRNRVVEASFETGSNSKMVVVFGSESSFVVANLAASLTWQGSTVCLFDFSPDLSAVDFFSTEHQGLEQVRGDPVGAWKKGGRPKELPGLLIITGTPENVKDLPEALSADFIIVHVGKYQPKYKLPGNEGKTIETYREGNNNVILKVGPGENEVYIISVGHLSSALDKARKRRVPVMLLSPEVADAFAKLSANMFLTEGG